MATIALIGILVGLLLPAVQSARESSRRNTCAGNMRQVALALQSYHHANGVMPMLNMNMAPQSTLKSYITSGNYVQSYQWGKPDTWAAAILPQLEQLPLFNAFDFKLSISSTAPSASQTVPNYTLIKTKILSNFVCPSDPMAATPILDNRRSAWWPSLTSNSVDSMQGLWYCASMGPISLRPGGSCPPAGSGAYYNCPFCPKTSQWGNLYSGNSTNPCCTVRPAVAVNDGKPPCVRGPADLNAVGFFGGSLGRVTFNSIVDGLSNTIMVGETLPAEFFENGVFMYTSHLSTSFPINVPTTIVFDVLTNYTGPESLYAGIRSRHNAGSQVAMGDGSVRFLSDTISFPLLWSLGSRNSSGIEVVPAIVE